MRTILTTWKVRSAIPAVFAVATLAAGAFIASTPADARIGAGRPGVGVGRVGSGIGFRPGVGVGRAGLGWAGWRGGVGYSHRWGYGYGAAAVAGAALGYAASSPYTYGSPYDLGYGPEYGSPYDYGYAQGGYPYVPGYNGAYGYLPAGYDNGGGCTCQQ